MYTLITKYTLWSCFNYYFDLIGEEKMSQIYAKQIEVDTSKYLVDKHGKSSMIEAPFSCVASIPMFCEYLA